MSLSCRFTASFYGNDLFTGFFPVENVINWVVTAAAGTEILLLAIKVKEKLGWNLIAFRIYKSVSTKFVGTRNCWVDLKELGQNGSDHAKS